MNEEFEKWRKSYKYGHIMNLCCIANSKIAYEAATEAAQTKVNNLTCELNKANELHTQCASELWDCKEELAALREFAQYELREKPSITIPSMDALDIHKYHHLLSKKKAFKLGLIGSYGKPTPLLTGEKE
jgi:hypothetical protein